MSRFIYACLIAVPCLAAGMVCGLLGGAPEVRREQLANEASHSNKPPQSARQPRAAQPIGQEDESEDDESDGSSEGDEESGGDEEPAPITHDEQLAIERQEQTEFREKFRREPVDQAWASEAERVARAVVARLPELPRGATVECRTTLCEIRPDGLDPASASQAIRALIKDPEMGAQFGVIRNTGDRVADDSVFEPMWYVIKAGTRRQQP